MTTLIGRDAELATLKQHLADAMASKGSTVLISGEPGIGKTALVEAFKEFAVTQNVKILSGAASADSAQPFLVFSKALAGEMDAPLFEEQEYTQFVKIFAINPAGMLVAEASSGEGDLDADIFAGMLSAVQNFVGDSLDTAGEQKTGLGRLEYGDMKILIEHGRHLFLTGVFSGGEHPDMKGTLKRALQRIEEEHGAALEKWSGKVSETEPVRKEIERLAEARFLVRRDLEGVKLENERIRIADEVLETLNRASTEKPMALLLEDLHWADESSLFVINYLARNIRNLPITMLVTSRPNEYQAMDNVVEKMRNEGILILIVLNTLDGCDITEIINVMYPENDFPSNFIGMLAERSGGTPLFVIEFLKHMKDECSITERDGKYVIVNDNYSIPETIEDVIQNRLSGLGPEALAVAEYASCIGREFIMDVVMSINTVMHPNLALDELHVKGITLKHNGVAEFCHALYPYFIYSTISPRWKTAYHRNIAEHLEKAYQGRHYEVVYDLARHFSLCNDQNKSFSYSIAAGEKAEGSFATDLAIKYYMNAFQALDSLPIDEEKIKEKLRIQTRIGKLLSLLGEWEKAETIFRKNISFASDSHDKLSLAENNDLLGDMLRTKNAGEEAFKYIETAYALYEEEGNLKGMSHSLGSMGVYFSERSAYSKATECFHKRLEIAQNLDEPNEIARVMGNFALNYYYQSEFQKALEYNLKQLEITERVKDKRAIGTAYANIGAISVELERYHEAMEYYNKSMKILQELGDIRAVSNVFGNMGIVYRKLGDYEKAMECYSKRLDIAKRIDHKRGMSYSYANIANIYRDQGKYSTAMDYYKLDLQMSEEMGDKKGIAITTGNIGDLHANLGEFDKAEEHYDIAISIGRELDIADVICNFAYSKADVLLSQERVDEANRFASESLELAEKLQQWELIFSNRLLIAKIQNKKNKNQATEQLLSLLKECEERLENNLEDYDFAKIQYKEATIFIELNRIQEARTLLNSALSVYESKNMRVWAEKCRKALKELDQ